MTNNVSAVMDESYNYSMWVELYNTSTTTSYNQSFYYLTDQLSQPKKWAPSSKLIGANSFSVLWFERSSRSGHANFKLDPDGGKLYLINSSLQVVDSVIYPAQYRNISYGRKTNGDGEWVYFEQFSNGSTNNGKKYASTRCDKPELTLSSGFYTGTKYAAFVTPSYGDTIYYTLNGAEPTRKSTRYNANTTITINTTRILRAKTFSAGKLSSDIVSATYFINVRDYNLPVVSIITEPANLTDNTIGIYVQGTNGIWGNGVSSPANWNQDWDRPANFELFDTTLVSRLNQELDISIAGGWSRLNNQKSLKINPTKKYYYNNLNYDIFKASKPGMKYRSILLRNSGNDFYYSMLRDGFMQSLVMKRMDLDCIAYEPAVCFMNGEYYGIQNLRERSDVDFVYSNYGYNEEDIKLLESYEMAQDTSFANIINYITYNDITQQEVYNKVCQMIDIESFTNCFLSEIYMGNTDWPDNNVKVWKKIQGGKWRWIFFDTDFGYSLYDTSLYNHNTLIYALGELASNVPDSWATILLRRLVLNDNFRKKFIDKFAIHISSTFDYNRSASILDSLALKINTEISYHKSRWPSYRDFNSDIANMKNFALNRPAKMLGFISSRFLSNAATKTIGISANIDKASYTFNNEQIQDKSINLKYFSGQTVTLSANSIPGYRFLHWVLNGSSVKTTIIENGSSWKYSDGNAIPSAEWYTETYNDNSWKTGYAQFGYGSRGEVTTIDYGSNSSNKYPTAYFRKTFSISNLSSKSNFTVSTLVDDGIVVYVNGTEIGRGNMPSGNVNFNTVAAAYNNGETFTFTIPPSLLKEGNNVIATEVHQNAVTSSDMIFNLSVTCDETSQSTTIETPQYSTTLSADFSIKAIYEETGTEEPNDENLIKINEVVSSNSIFQDENMDTDDYIEIFNSGNDDINIAGWYISDLEVNPTLHQIANSEPSKTTVPAKGRIILWADNETNQGANHLNFKLSKDGETILLSKPNGNGIAQLVDSVHLPALGQNISYARVPDGSGNWLRQAPTFNASNSIINNLDDTGANTLNLYPTMVNNFVIIENSQGKTLTISDMTGRIVATHNCLSNNEQLIIQYLRKGIYLVRIEQNTFKIIKL
ncbi:MAG: exported protein of unknown function [Bacteroidetes bacterium]|nr:exported protein of unknown function [Bacteroidota bacterium]